MEIFNQEMQQLFLLWRARTMAANSSSNHSHFCENCKYVFLNV
ncbi:unnamed protein product [Brassica rapa]|uniref:Uncharacterized protein n=2 Tax=Brassica TaxID=3705 RepID=A0A8D9G6D6_BRACM|nr:unnamed protein product [Brassica napus]CAG7869759.1 unnamed protein product [Brassica rapa]